MNPRRPRETWLHAGFGLYCAVTLAAVTWPIYPALGNRVRPLVLGLPFSLAWIVGWVVLTFVVLALYERAAQRDPEDRR